MSRAIWTTSDTTATPVGSPPAPLPVTSVFPPLLPTSRTPFTAPSTPASCAERGIIIGRTKIAGGRLAIFLPPMMIPRSAPPAGGVGAGNGVLLVGGKGGETLGAGRGGGGGPTGG